MPTLCSRLPLRGDCTATTYTSTTTCPRRTDVVSGGQGSGTTRPFFFFCFLRKPTARMTEETVSRAMNRNMPNRTNRENQGFPWAKKLMFFTPSRVRTQFDTAISATCLQAPNPTQPFIHFVGYNYSPHVPHITSFWSSYTSVYLWPP